MEWLQFKNGRVNISVKGKKDKLTLNKSRKIVSSSHLLSVMDLSILKDGRVHFGHLGIKVYVLEIITPFLKNGLIPYLWNSLFQNFRGEALEKLSGTPLFSTMDLSISKDGRVHFRHLGMKAYMFEIITPFLKMNPSLFFGTVYFKILGVKH